MLLPVESPTTSGMTKASTSHTSASSGFSSCHHEKVLRDVQDRLSVAKRVLRVVRQDSSNSCAPTPASSDIMRRNKFYLFTTLIQSKNSSRESLLEREDFDSSYSFSTDDAVQADRQDEHHVDAALHQRLATIATSPGLKKVRFHCKFSEKNR